MPSEKQYQERKENIAAILQYLRANGKRSRRQIADALQLSWGCVSELTWLLLSQKLLLEEAAATAAKGRTPGVLSLNPAISFLGVVVEKSGLTASICSLTGRQTAAYTEPLDYSSKEVLLACVRDFTHRILARHPQIQAICFAMQGIFHREKQLWQFPTNPRIPIHFETDLQPLFPLPTMVEHDTNCVLYGTLNTPEDKKMILHLSHGIGAALYTPTGFSHSDLMEFGYLVVDPQGQTMQQVASLDAFRRHCGDGSDEEKNRRFFADMGAHLGTALGNLCNLIHLDEILLCGNMVRHAAHFCPSLNENYDKTVLPTGRAAITVIPDANAAFGAARMAMDKFQY